jgi:hypothetical protein
LQGWRALGDSTAGAVAGIREGGTATFPLGVPIFLGGARMDCIVGGIELTATQRHAYSQTPDAGFFDAFDAAYEQLQQQDAGSAPADGGGATLSLADVLGDTQTEMADIRGVDADDQREYATILHQAYTHDGLNDPQQFLQSLSASDLDVVRRIHCLADTINPGTLSDEGASNLLLPEGYSVDLDHDGIDEVGAAKTLHFPPRDAPAAFTDAWFQATQDLGFGDYAMASMTFLSAFHPPQTGGTVATGPPSSSVESYQTVVDNYLSMLDHYRGMLPKGQYERDYPFFSKLKGLLDAAE